MPMRMREHGPGGHVGAEEREGEEVGDDAKVTPALRRSRKRPSVAENEEWRMSMKSTCPAEARDEESELVTKWRVPHVVKNMTSHMGK